MESSSERLTVISPRNREAPPRSLGVEGSGGCLTGQLSPDKPPTRKLNSSSVALPTAKQRGEHVVYVLRAYNGLLKFGHTRDLRNRIGQIQATSPDPIECVAWAPGEAAEEAALHLRLVDHHSHSEWFHPSPAALAVVANFRRIVAALRRKHPVRFDAHYYAAPKYRREYRAILNARRAALSEAA